jgi:hypothetical protein
MARKTLIPEIQEIQEAVPDPEFENPAQFRMSSLRNRNAENQPFFLETAKTV